jgi:uncharacterized membrane protein (DUF106 family)
MKLEILNFISLYPKSSIIVISALVTLISTLATKWLTNQEHLKTLKARQKEIQKDLKNHKPGEKKFEELQQEMLEITGHMMKSSFKPMFATFIPFLLLFYLIRNVYGVLLPGWIWYYLGSSIVFSIIYRKVFDMA